jgi:hypothetical protein
MRMGMYMPLPPETIKIAISENLAKAIEEMDQLTAQLRMQEQFTLIDIKRQKENLILRYRNLVLNEMVQRGIGNDFEYSDSLKAFIPVQEKKPE